MTNSAQFCLLLSVRFRIMQHVTMQKDTDKKIAVDFSTRSNPDFMN